MATANSLTTRGTSARRSSNAFDNVAAGVTDSVLVAAVPGKSIRVTRLFANGRDAGTSTFTFNSKGGGAGTPISPTFGVPKDGGFVLADSDGWFETLPGEALTVTTGGASATAFLLNYELETN